MKLSAAVLAFSLAALVAPATADQPQAPKGEAVQSTAPLAEVEPALYAVRDEDSTIYLFGTVHVRRPGSQWGGLNARNALNEAGEVWTELEISPETQARAQVLVLQRGMAPEAESLQVVLTDQEYEKLSVTASRLGISIAMLNRMRPWLASISLSMTPMLQAGYDAAAGVDNAIDAAAAANGQTMRVFETIDQQIGFLADLPFEVQRQMLMDSLNQPGTPGGAIDVDAISAAWEHGDEDTLRAEIVDSMRSEYPHIYDVMFVRRNAAWMEVLLQELEGSGVDFVAVGAGHMLGPDGLVAQFRARGVVVERVDPASPASQLGAPSTRLGILWRQGLDTTRARTKISRAGSPDLCKMNVDGPGDEVG